MGKRKNRVKARDFDNPPYLNAEELDEFSRKMTDGELWFECETMKVGGIVADWLGMTDKSPAAHGFEMFQGNWRPAEEAKAMRGESALTGVPTQHGTWHRMEIPGVWCAS